MLDRLVDFLSSFSNDLCLLMLLSTILGSQILCSASFRAAFSCEMLARDDFPVLDLDLDLRVFVSLAILSVTAASCWLRGS